MVSWFENDFDDNSFTGSLTGITWKFLMSLWKDYLIGKRDFEGQLNIK